MVGGGAQSSATPNDVRKIRGSQELALRTFPSLSGTGRSKSTISDASQCAVSTDH